MKNEVTDYIRMRGIRMGRGGGKKGGEKRGGKE